MGIKNNNNIRLISKPSKKSNIQATADDIKINIKDLSEANIYQINTTMNELANIWKQIKTYKSYNERDWTPCEARFITLMDWYERIRHHTVFQPKDSVWFLASVVELFLNDEELQHRWDIYPANIREKDFWMYDFNKKITAIESFITQIPDYDRIFDKNQNPVLLSITLSSLIHSFTFPQKKMAALYSINGLNNENQFKIDGEIIKLNNANIYAEHVFEEPDTYKDLKNKVKDFIDFYEKDIDFRSKWLKVPSFNREDLFNQEHELDIECQTVLERLKELIGLKFLF